MANVIRLMVDTATGAMARVISAVMVADPTAIIAMAHTSEEAPETPTAATPPKAKRAVRVGAGVAMVAYVPAKAITSAKIKDMKLTPQQRTIAALVIKKSPVTHATLTEKTGMNYKSVQSALYQLRHTTPPVIKSVPRPESK